jgi:predicted nucleic-acid-binding Zn-ribbon protein
MEDITWVPFDPITFKRYFECQACTNTDCIKDPVVQTTTTTSGGLLVRTTKTPVAYCTKCKYVNILRFSTNGTDGVTWNRVSTESKTQRKFRPYQHKHPTRYLNMSLSFRDTNKLITELMSPNCKYTELDLTYSYTLGNIGQSEEDFTDLGELDAYEYDRDLMGRLFMAIALCPFISSVSLRFVRVLKYTSEDGNGIHDQAIHNEDPVPMVLLNVLKYSKHICELTLEGDAVNAPDEWEKHNILDPHFFMNKDRRLTWYALTPVIGFYRANHNSKSTYFRESILTKMDATAEQKEDECRHFHDDAHSLNRPMLENILRFCGVKYDVGSTCTPVSYVSETPIDIAVNLMSVPSELKSRDDFNATMNDIRTMITQAPTDPRVETYIDPDFECDAGFCTKFIHSLTDTASKFVDTIFFASVTRYSPAEISLLGKYEKKRKFDELKLKI